MSLVREKPKKIPHANILIPPPTNKRHTSSPKKSTHSIYKMPQIQMLPQLSRSLEATKKFKPRLKLPSPREMILNGSLQTEGSFQNSSTETEVKSARALGSSHHNVRMIANRIITEPVSRHHEPVERSVESPNSIPQSRKRLKLLTSTKVLKPLNTDLTKPREEFSTSTSASASVPHKGDTTLWPRRLSMMSKDKSKTNKKLTKSTMNNVSSLKINTPISGVSVAKEGELSARSHKEPAYRNENIEDENEIPTLGPTKHSIKENGFVQAYAANTHKGLVRDYNEDRVAIILNISKPTNSKYEGVWPKCSYFAIFDGHGGDSCADYLRDHLHHMIVKNGDFPRDPVSALRKGCQEAEEKFLERAEGQNFAADRSGSCAIVVLIVDDICYVANVGDSRAIMSCNRGTKVIDLSKDHKPDEESEKERIEKNGGKTYQVQISQPTKGVNGSIFASNFTKVVYGPHRVLPGRLSVSRTFGDIEAKFPKYGGLPNVVTAEPEIKTYKITDGCDFIILGCDGIFDKLSSYETAKCVWDSTDIKLPNCHQQTAAGVEFIMKEAFIQKTMDNITVVMVALAGFKNALTSYNTTPSLDETSAETLKGGTTEVSPKLATKKPNKENYLRKVIQTDLERVRSHSPMKQGRSLTQIKTKSKIHLSSVKKLESSEDLTRSRPSPISRMPYIRNKKSEN